MRPSNLEIPPKRLQGHHWIHDRIVYLVKPRYHQREKVEVEGNAQFIFPPWEDPQLFGNSQPVHLEYCSGNGAWIANKALANPHINWVAVELKLGRTRKIWSKIKNLQIPNLVVINGEGEYASQNYLPKNSVSAIYINFPDPWPKRYQSKKRIIQPSFLNALATLLKEKGEIIIVTDDPLFSEWTLKTFKNAPQFSCSIEAPYYKTEWPNYGSSYFEDLWREKGRTIRYHHFQKSG